MFSVSWELLSKYVWILHAIISESLWNILCAHVFRQNGPFGRTSPNFWKFPKNSWPGLTRTYLVLKASQQCIANCWSEGQVMVRLWVQEVTQTTNLLYIFTIPLSKYKIIAIYAVKSFLVLGRLCPQMPRPCTSNALTRAKGTARHELHWRLISP